MDALVQYIAGTAEAEAIHTERRRKAIARVVAHHEQSAVFHEVAATRFDQQASKDQANRERQRADYHIAAANLDRDLLNQAGP
jgi:hypothetical protein